MGTNDFYADLRKDETAVLKTNRTFLALIPTLLGTLLMIGAGIGGYFGLDYLFTYLSQTEAPPSAVGAFIAAIEYILLISPVGGVFNFIIVCLRLKNDFLVLTSKKYTGARVLSIKNL